MPDKPIDTSAFTRRVQLKVTGPRRGSGGLFRSAEFAYGAGGGVPMVAGEDIVVNVVRMAYKVASAQIDRSTRLARRLRESGERVVGDGGERQALDGLEKLVMDSVMSGLEWWEGSVTEGRCPVKRLVAAEYQLFGTLLGLSAQGERMAASTPASTDAAGETRPLADADASKAPAQVPAPVSATARLPAPRIKLFGTKEKRRRVLFGRWQLAASNVLDPELYFLHESGAGAGFSAQLTPLPQGDSAYQLALTSAPTGPPGLWAAAICDPHGVQIGFIEITL